jgi:hypothetical protein
MATTTPNFGWVVPTSSDLVKNGAVAIETLGDSIDASMVDLKGGTTGQVLAKATNTDMDFSWVAPSAFAVNLLLNSNFALNQRAYVSAANLASGAYGFDRWKSNYTNTTLTFTASTQGQSITINASGGLQQIIEQGLVPAGTYTLSWTGTATARVYNSGGTPPSYAASPVTFTADGTANVVVEFTASGSTKTLSKVMFNAGTGTTWSMATPTLESELSACQRYFYRTSTSIEIIGSGQAQAITELRTLFQFPVVMRSPATVAASSGSTFFIAYSGGFAAGFATMNTINNVFNATQRGAVIQWTCSTVTAGAGVIIVANSGSAYLEASAEL